MKGTHHQKTVSEQHQYNTLLCTNKDTMLNMENCQSPNSNGKVKITLSMHPESEEL